MKNATVARIVDMMFQDIEMTEEVAAIHDEVMNNCQERYADMISAGMLEDDAIAAVVESLKGMETVIAQYPRRSRPASQPVNACGEEDDEDEYVDNSGDRDLTFYPGEISSIDLTLVSEDVTVEASDDNLIHVAWYIYDEECISCTAANGVLRISRIPGAHAAVKNHAEAEESSSGGLFNSLGRSLGRMFRSVKTSMTGCDEITLRIPASAHARMKLQTVSGDIDVTDVAMPALIVGTTSGNITISCGEEYAIGCAEVRTISGDVDADLCTDDLQASSTSGDVTVNGIVTKLNVSSVSGDLDLQAHVVSVHFKTVSGDASLFLESDDVREINGSTVSGDISIDLPMDMGAVSIAAKSRSGDVSNTYDADGNGPTVTGSVSSMSGDITIR